jgi:hypothetical protein
MLCVLCLKLLISRSMNWKLRYGHLQQSNGGNGVLTSDAPPNNRLQPTAR